jgi:hypothetical protein
MFAVTLAMAMPLYAASVLVAVCVIVPECAPSTAASSTAVTVTV